ncbi:cytochrome b561 [Sinobacterium caligoides]|uniref:Cytochrome b561 n=1 Tax=Sinobacterium caligoides TaxID=933926 RepID=A0A3N2DQB6_9GAMM|nr:cytochrome b [Sinobacterium caligoides]ROS01983.1 cytochrome b561 [Sinobacterium caligoides]
MALKNTHSSFGLTTKMIHWAMFILILMTIVGGYQLDGMPDGDAKWAAFDEHKSFGALILILALARLVWRFINVVPTFDSLTASEHRKAVAMQWLLYLLFIAQPLSGVIMSQAGGRPVSFFGLFNLPTIVAESKAIGSFAHSLHLWVWIALSVAIGLHILAALRHQFILKNDVLSKITHG